MSGAVELEAELRAGLDSPDGLWWKVGGRLLRVDPPELIRYLLDTIVTLRSDNERLGRERDADIDALHGTFSKPIAVLQERVAAAEAERDTLLAQVAKMRGALEPFAAAAEHFDCHVKDGDLFPRPPADRP